MEDTISVDEGKKNVTVACSPGSPQDSKGNQKSTRPFSGSLPYSTGVSGLAWLSQRRLWYPSFHRGQEVKKKTRALETGFRPKRALKTGFRPKKEG